MSGIKSSDFSFVRRLVRERAAIVLEEGKEYLVTSRLDTLARLENMTDHVELVARLRTQPLGPLSQRVIEAMTTNETSFYRDVRPFEILSTDVLPELIERRRSQRTLNIWCAACSTGQEPYTVWMVLQDHFPELASWHVTIIGTDISGEVIAKAKLGSYSQMEVGRGVPPRALIRHFRRDGARWQIHPDSRKVVEFRELNLIAPWPAMPKPDVVFLRNVMIYFDVGTRKQILARVARAMAPDGYLFLGAGESTLNLDSPFERLDLDRSGCFQLRAGPEGSPPAGPSNHREGRWIPRETASSP